MSSKDTTKSFSCQLSQHMKCESPIACGCSCHRPGGSGDTTSELRQYLYDLEIEFLHGVPVFLPRKAVDEIMLKVAAQKQRWEASILTDLKRQATRHIPVKINQSGVYTDVDDERLAVPVRKINERITALGGEDAPTN